MATEDTQERLARIETLMSGMQAEMATMRDALIRLVRIEEQHASTRDELARQMGDIRMMHERLDKYDERLDGLDEAVASIRGPLLWLAGIAASVVAGLVSLILGRVL